VSYSTQTYQVEGRSVLLVQIDESDRKPVYAKDEAGKYLAYLRIKDENILATPVHLCIWQQSESPQGELMEYTEREQLLLDLLEQNDRLSLNRYCRLARLSRRAAEHLLAKLIRYDIVEPVFEGHKFHFKLK
jgi:predicted HTH transcriptional regulator